MNVLQLVRIRIEIGDITRIRNKTQRHKFNSVRNPKHDRLIYCSDIAQLTRSRIEIGELIYFLIKLNKSHTITIFDSLHINEHEPVGIPESMISPANYDLHNQIRI